MSNTYIGKFLKVGADFRKFTKGSVIACIHIVIQLIKGTRHGAGKVISHHGHVQGSHSRLLNRRIGRQKASSLGLRGQQKSGSSSNINLHLDFFLGY